VTSAQNQIAVADDKMPDKADCIDQSISRLGFAVDAKDEGERTVWGYAKLSALDKTRTSDL
jgi:hypothetical protein